MQLLNAATLWRAFLPVVFVVWIAGCSGQAETIPPTSCTMALSPSSASHAASGGAGRVTVTTPAGCSWTARSDADWVTVTAGSSGSGSATVTYRVAENTTASARTASIEVLGADENRAAVLHRVSQAAPTRLRLRGAYTFVIRVDPDGACGWPVTTFYWPVTIRITSYEGDLALGSIIFPPSPGSSSNAWSISAGPTRTQLVPRQESPGPAGGAYDVVVDGGNWEAGGLVRAHDGRGEITSGMASGVKQILTLRDSGERWVCRADAQWSLLVRYVDLD